jgi:polysaccharide biosynthesis protein PslH
MRILQICNKVPFPPKDGGSIAMNNLTMGLLAEGHQVKVLAISTPKNFVELEKLPAEYKALTNVEIVFIDTGVKVIPAFLNLFSTESYNVNRFFSLEFEKKITDLLSSETYDIILLESLFVSMYVPAIRKKTNAKIVLRSHNIEHKIWERNAAVAGNPLKKTYLNFLAKRLKKYEKSSLEYFDAIAPITKEDAKWYVNMQFTKPIKTIPFGIDLSKIQEEIKTEAVPEDLSVFHIGAMDWQPNIEGVQWFLNNIWDRVNQLYPDLKLYLAGRKMTGDIVQIKKPNVIVSGEVENAYQFMRSKGLMIVPLLAGGGMRVKIIEGMALGKVIISTAVGAEGINYINGENIIIANNPDEFINAIGRYVLSADHLSSIGKNAKLVAAKDYNNSNICKDLTALFESLRTTI